MTTLLERFIPESRDYLESAAAGLLKLERDPADEGLINEVFRAVHTLKGASGLFDIPGLTRLVHAGEDVLGAVREGRLGLDSEMVDLLLGALDHVSNWIDGLERHGCLPADADGVSAGLSKRLWDFMPAPDGAPRTEPAALRSTAPPAWLDDLAPASLRAAFENADGPIVAVSYMPDDGCFYRAEDPFNLLQQLPGLRLLRAVFREAPGALAEADPFRSLLGFQALVAQPRSEIEQLLRYVLDQVTLYEVAAASSSASSPPSSMAARLIEEQRRIIMLPGDDATLASRLTAVSFTLGTLLTSLDWLDHQEALAAATDRESLIAVIDLLLQRAAPTLGAPSVAPVVAPVAGSGPAAIAIPAVSADGRKPLPRMLRVDQDKVDALMTLIAELVVSKNSLPFLARRAEDVYGSRDMSREIKDQYSVIDRLAQEMQRAILDIRMLPVSEVFERFPRLVRDLSRKLEKQITLKVIGEETAADKNIIEALGDPLIHLVRNSIDHGIESPEQRAAAGKPEAATIQLRAWQEGDQVIIEVSDDGKGIDPAIVKAKALEKGLITVEKAHSMTDQDAINLIFLPGFSTAASISDLSGRGVGMDVVRTAIEKINGHVTLSSELGAGTLIRLSLPLSMAVSRVMMIEIGDGLFGVPMDIIVETVKIPRSLIRSIKRAEAFVLRNAIIPLLRLRSLLELAPREGVAEEEAVLVVRVANSTVGLVVDRFREGIDVIQKPMDGLLAGMRGYSGSALLGDGRVLLVLNLKELL